MTSRRFIITIAPLLLAVPAEALGDAKVLITEIMYNPASVTGRVETEWVEIANVGDEAIDLKGWRLDDEDRGIWGTFDCTLEPGGIAVLVNAGRSSVENFREAWDEDPEAEEPAYQIIAIKWGNLANKADEENELLRLLDTEGEPTCEVNYQTGSGWPRDRRKYGGSSIWLADLGTEDLGDGDAWKLSVEDEAGAWTCLKTEAFNGPDTGSPGHVEGLGDEDDAVKDDTPPA